MRKVGIIFCMIFVFNTVVCTATSAQVVNQIVIKRENGSLTSVEIYKVNERVYISIEDVEKLFHVVFEQSDISNMYRLSNFVENDVSNTGEEELDREESVRNIYGTLYYEDGRVYTGDLLEGEPSGEGVLLWSNRTVYEGSFFEGYPHGEGHYIYPNGDDYRGQVRYGTVTGYGRMRYQNEDVYKGYFYFGIPDGAGIYTKYKDYVRQGLWEMGVYKYYMSDEEMENYFFNK